MNKYNKKLLARIWATANSQHHFAVAPLLDIMYILNILRFLSIQYKK